MKTRGLTILLIVSLALNCAVAGALTHRIFFKTSSPGDEGAPLQESVIPDRGLPPPVREERRGFGRQIRGEKKRMIAEQQRLMELLREETIDRQDVHDTVDRFNSIQSEMRRLIIDRIVDELSYLSPKDRKRYLSKLERRMMMKPMKAGRHRFHEGTNDRPGRGKRSGGGRKGKRPMPGGGDGQGYLNGEETGF